jgi:hypothetical protein
MVRCEMRCYLLPLSTRREKHDHAALFFNTRRTRHTIPATATPHRRRSATTPDCLDAGQDRAHSHAPISRKMRGPPHHTAPPPAPNPLPRRRDASVIHTGRLLSAWKIFPCYFWRSSPRSLCSSTFDAFQDDTRDSHLKTRLRRHDFVKRNQRSIDEKSSEGRIRGSRRPVLLAVFLSIAQ